MDKPKYTAEISINLGGAHAQLHNELQVASNMVAAGLNSAQYITADSFQLSVTGMVTISPSRTLPWTLDDGRSRFERWVVTNGFRDAIESVSSFLEQFRNVLAVWRLQQRQPITGAEWQLRMEKELVKFHRLGLPDKITHLSKEYGFTLNQDLVAQVLSINKVRNCLVHRGGAVTRLDTEPNDTLQLHTLRFGLVVSGDAGDRDVTIPCVLQAGERLGMQSRPVLTEYKLGEIVALTSPDFLNVTWTLMLFGQSATQALQLHGERMGIVIQQPTPLAPAPAGQ